ncbi:hypothetical protein SAMN04487843_11624 [Methylobacterium sp. ap11]|uniref:hypothetical protein n=1 Tax=Methylobacterium sp. ap11 TaxID=1761799 RepID=UPI0008D5E18B|nr:hypothetical protein [Methylobacterium sp. ap11]SEP40738.1 hypothetical protein SAMN04487843_11624 [Methylobacterium sp. ap11]
MDSVDHLIRRTPLYAARDRYDGGRAVTPGSLARPRPSEGVRSAVAAVADPWPDPERDPLAEPERVHVTVNRCTDLLEREASHGRISREAYLIGRVIAEVFERRAGPCGAGSPEGGNRVDHTVAHELAILLAIDDGRLVEGLLDQLREAIGTVGTRFLHQILAEGRDFAGIARGLGRGDGRVAVAGVAQRFRDLLEDVAADWLARQSGQGRETGRIVGAAAAPGAPGEATDAAGCLVPAGQAYAVGADPDGALRWQPAWKRQAAERQAQAALARTRGARRR